MTLLSQCLRNQDKGDILNTKSTFDPKDNSCEKEFTVRKTARPKTKIKSDVVGFFEPTHTPYKMTCQYYPIKKNCRDRDPVTWTNWFPSCRAYYYSYADVVWDSNHRNACTGYLNNNTGFGQRTRWSYGLKEKQEAQHH